MPERIREAIPKILAPAYRRFVLKAPGELERSIGVTLVHLTWIELCEQIKLAGVVADPTSIDAILNNPEDLLDRHLRLTTVKCQTAELLMKLQIVQNALRCAARPANSSDNPLPSHPALPALPSPLSPGEVQTLSSPLPPGKSQTLSSSLPPGEGHGEGSRQAENSPLPLQITQCHADPKNGNPNPR